MALATGTCTMATRHAQLTLSRKSPLENCSQRSGLSPLRLSSRGESNNKNKLLLDMKNGSILFLCLLSPFATAQKTKDAALQGIDAKAQQYASTAHKIWEFA